MYPYEAPVDDMRFVFSELLADEPLNELPGYDEFSVDLVGAILEEAGKFCTAVLQPLNRSGDEQGCQLENGVVRTPDGFKEAYRSFSEAGWVGLVAHPEFGGQGAPHTVDMQVQEMLCSTNMAFSMYPGLTHGAYNAIYAHGTKEQKQTYLPKLVNGTWSGTMCLTEPHCGTDLGLIRTKAEPSSNGSYKISGTKIFISAGEHDLTDNIIHLVLARLPDAPSGIKGISMFVVPKFLPNAQGEPGPRNGVSCSAIEHKMGISASSTCVMNFDDAEGHLVGTAHKGMRAMFTMMNAARLAVAIQGLGLSVGSYQAAVAYAKERLQGRALTGAAQPDEVADAILVHPDVRRMLLTMRAYSEGARALSGWVAARLDVADRHPEPAMRESAHEFVSLLTPVVKAFFTDLGTELTNLGVQVYGGHGYVREQGMEQFVRDARICQLYEGANGVQAMDLVGRKLPARMGRNLRGFFHPVAEFIEVHSGDEAMAPYVEPLAKAFGRLQRATGWIAERGMKNPNEAGAAASDYLRLFGLTALAFMWARAAKIALEKSSGDESGFYQAKLGTARFFMERLLPQSGAHFSAIMAGAASTMEFDGSAF